LIDRPTVFPVLADIRDRARLESVFNTYRPEVVFHAAALKHVPALESAPDEGWKTNVLGTRNVLAAAEATGVARFVNISTDKAADPVSVLGHTKRIAEQLTAAVALRSDRRYVSVRFGNVIGSRGSVMETFQAQIEAGGPVTVTHPEVTRFFMACREAVRLTLQAATMGSPGEVLVLDMGAPVKIADVARQLIEQSGRDITISYTGLRPGEKLHEVLLSGDEAATRPHHALIDHVNVPAAWPDLPGEYDLMMIEALAALDRDRYDAPTVVPRDSTPVAATEADR
jgi:FlaA1/EpsC-like NDP-sugar epimerase